MQNKSITTHASSKPPFIMAKPELIFFPTPLMGHVAQMVELAKLILNREENIRITILLSKLPESIESVSGPFIDSLAAANQEPHLHFINLPPTDPNLDWSAHSKGYFVQRLIESHMQNVNNFIHQRMQGLPESRITGFVVDMLCTPIMEVAQQFGLSSYVFLTSGAAFLGQMLYFQKLHDEEKQDISELVNKSKTGFFSPFFSKPVPPSVIPKLFVEEQKWEGRFLGLARGYRKARGIIVNTFDELESYALNALAQDPMIPPVYTVGPIINRASRGSEKTRDEILKWLDGQPAKSVVFICFGSLGSLDDQQIQELARALERSGHRFLWALRKRSKDNTGYPGEYDNFEDVLPNNFLDNTIGVGKIVGWVPQLDVLAHEAIGGFISHCGWNSTLESIWNGVPIATWPLHSEQQLNAFQLVKEENIGVEISLDYLEVREEQDLPLVTAEEIERGLRILMESDNKVRNNVAKMTENARKSIVVGGSSYANIGRLIQDMIN